LGQIRTIFSEKGFSLVENLVAMVILGIIGLVILTGLFIAARSNIISNEQTRAESLARSQIESIQNQTYSPADPPVYSEISIPADCQGYSFATPLAVRLDPAEDGLGSDDGLQKITVTVIRNSKTILTIEDYKVNKGP